MTRREFIAASALALPALSPALSLAGRTREPKRTLRKAVMFGMVGGDLTVAQKFRLLKECGFEGVEMDSPTTIPMQEIAAAAKDTGIVVHGLVDSLHWKFHLNSPDAAVRAKGLEALETALRDGKTLGVASILLVPGVVNEKQPYDQAWELTQAEIRKALPLARECGVKIAIENVWNNFLLSPLEAARYVDEFKDPMVAFHFDIGNVINYGYPDQWVRVLGKRIAKLHIKDFSRKKRNDEGLWKGFDVQLGEGDAGWASVMKALDEVGYSTAPAGNWATAEVGGGDAARLRTVSDQMDKLFAM
ncbi:MAG: sugar phosphate isomerase/epimerase [Planctomycetes bacterium]|nr:sugar phosphate isomerase/epimerase [Planctomycetota bacterium]